ncbi:MAG: DUF4924 family protein [Flavobacteriales bacterium]
MFVAQEKIKSNIAEYVLYMWHVEDRIRAYHFDITDIEKNIVEPSGLSMVQKIQLKNWYLELIDKMRKSRLDKKGHLEEVNDKIAELTLLHTTLLQAIKDKEYIALYESAKPEIEELKKRSEIKLLEENPDGEKKSTIVKNDVVACFNGLYGLWLLRLQKKKVSAETTEAMKKISAMMANLSAKYHSMMSGN